MARVEKKAKKSDNQDKKKMFISLFLLVIMVASIAGFALIMSPGGNIGTGDNGLPEELPLQQIEDNGELVWVTIRNSQLFVFDMPSADKYIQDTQSAQLAQRVEQHDKIQIYVDEGFNSLESVYLFEKALTGERIIYEEVDTFSCTPDTFVFTYDMQMDGECMILDTEPDSAYTDTESLVYHIVKE